MLEFVVFVFGLSLVLYIVFAGADFGAGIYELLCLISGRSSRKELIEEAIGPIWEANHIWLILCVVIAFMGFPGPFSLVSTQLHIPLAMILIGITLRGTAFAFRHYDPYQDHWQKKYSWIFGLSSLWTAFWQGVTVAALFRPFPKAPAHFFEAYISPWFSAFNFAVGLFVVAVYLFLAQTFFLGEPTNPRLKDSLRKDFSKGVGFVVAAGLVVFLTGEIQSVHFNDYFFKNQWSIFSIILTTCLIAPLMWSYVKSYPNISRVIAGAQVALIFMAAALSRMPALIYFDDGSTLNYRESAAPEASIEQLFYALAGGVILILPFLFYLYKIFKTAKETDLK